ncbi:hypothetical protein [Helicobacter pylori]|uniref:hypothetical protein n=1 Tax=Helicobacter pylori TaxID=210 RepID=UPI000348024A|nr:hypothetical protein [Helicobacter pylori]
MLIVAEAVSALNKKVVAAKKNKIRFTPNSYIHNNRNKNRRYSSLSPLLKSSSIYKNHLEFKLF